MHLSFSGQKFDIRATTQVWTNQNHCPIRSIMEMSFSLTISSILMAAISFLMQSCHTALLATELDADNSLLGLTALTRDSQYKPRYTSSIWFGGDCHYGDFIMLNELGKGDSSVVYLVQHRPSSAFYVVKKFNKDYPRDHPDLIYYEEEILSRVDHPMIVKFYCSMVDPLDGSVMFVMQHLPGKTLFEMINEKYPFTRQERINIVIKLLSIIRYLHARDIAVRDVKDQNLIVSPDLSSITLIDLGLAIPDRDNQLQAKNIGQVLGARAYSAPEKRKFQNYGRSADYYSIGMMIYHLSVGKLPDRSFFSWRMVGSPLPPTGDADFDRVIQILTDPDHVARWNNVNERFEDFMRHPLFQ